MFNAPTQTKSRTIQIRLPYPVSCILILCTLLMWTFSAGHALATPEQVRAQLPKHLGSEKDTVSKTLVRDENKLFEFHVPGLPLKTCAFYTKRGGWTVALKLSGDKETLAPIVDAYSRMGVLGNDKEILTPRTALFVVNEKGCGVTVKELSGALKKGFSDVVDTKGEKAADSPRAILCSGIGIPGEGPLAELADTLAASGIFDGDTMKIKGVFPLDVIKALLRHYIGDRVSSPGKPPSTEGVRLSIELPTSTPFPFSDVSRSGGRGACPFSDIRFGETTLDISLGKGLRAGADMVAAGAGDRTGGNPRTPCLQALSSSSLMASPSFSRV